VTIQDRILQYLAQHPEGVDDDELTVALGLKQRQQANMRCRKLQKFGIVIRRRVDGKIRNFLNPDAVLAETKRVELVVDRLRRWPSSASRKPAA